jgi:ubiquinone/menaquinone biosynthesis C-methylase UbiE
MSFQDHFSKQSDIYLKARPSYPNELFAYLASLAPSTEMCWDCATGNGQAAISLAKHFKKVIATDASKQQVKNGMPAVNVEYRVATAEESGLANRSVDLITVATAAHWFNCEKFYLEAERVSKPNGILAVWTYSEAKICAEIDELMEWFMYDYLHDYWPNGRWHVRNKYQTLPFPFHEINTPRFCCKMMWSKKQWINYVKSWSSYTNYVTQHGNDPLTVITDKLNMLWNDIDTMEVIWALHLKCARLHENQ